MENIIIMLNELSATWTLSLQPILIQSTLLAVVVFFITRLINLPAKLQFWLWMLVPLRLLIMPLVTVPLPIIEKTTIAQQIPATAKQPLNIGAKLSQIDLDFVSNNKPLITKGLLFSKTNSPKETNLTLSSYLFCFWIFGSVLMAIRLLIGVFKIKHVLANATPINEPQLNKLITNCALQIGLKKIPKILICNANNSAFVSGVFKPVVVLPSILLNTATNSELECILTHEFAHIRRRDSLFGWIVSCCELIYFFHPVVYLAKYFLLLEREHACDCYVLTHCQVKPSQYARTLLNAAQMSPQTGIHNMVTASSFSQLKQRITFLTDVLSTRYQLSPITFKIIVALSIVALPGLRLTTGVAEASTAPSVSVTTTEHILEIQVNDANGLPVAGAQVEALAEYRHLTDAITDITGLAKLKVNKNAPIQWIFAKKDNQGMDYYSFIDALNIPSFSAIDLLTVNPKQTITAQSYPKLITLTLSGGKELHIETIDNQGKYIAGIKLTPWIIDLPNKKHGINLSGSHIAAQTSDINGLAHFNWLPSNALHVSGSTFVVQNNDYYWAQPSEDIYQGNGKSIIQANLKRRVKTTGQVYYPDNTPAQNIRVVAQSNFNGNNIGHDQAITNQNGQFSLWVNANHRVSVSIDDPQWAAPIKTLLVSEQNDELVEIALIKGKRVTGRLIHKDKNSSAPVANARVSLGSVDKTYIADINQKSNFFTKKYADISVFRSTTTDAKGYFSFSVTSGEYSLIVPEKSGKLSVHDPLRFSIDQTSNTAFNVNVEIKKPIVPLQLFSLLKANRDVPVEYLYHQAAEGDDQGWHCMSCHRPHR